MAVARFHKDPVVASFKEMASRRGLELIRTGVPQLNPFVLRGSRRLDEPQMIVIPHEPSGARTLATVSKRPDKSPPVLFP